MKEILFDYSKLRGKIKEMFGTQSEFAEAMQISSVSLSKKLNNKVQFSQKEIGGTCDMLQISKEEIPIYFFYTKS